MVGAESSWVDIAVGLKEKPKSKETRQKSGVGMWFCLSPLESPCLSVSCFHENHAF